MFYQNELFAIEEKESKIAIMKANAMFESVMDTNTLYMMESPNSESIKKAVKSAKEAVKKFIQTIIENLKETARKAEFKFKTKLNDIRFDYHVKQLKKSFRVTGVSVATRNKKITETGMRAVVNVEKFKKEFIKCAKICQSQIKLYKKCKFPGDVERVKTSVEAQLQKMETFIKTKGEQFKEQKKVTELVDMVDDKTLKEETAEVINEIESSLKETQSEMEDIIEETMDSAPETEEIKEEVQVKKSALSAMKNNIAKYSSIAVHFILSISMILSSIVTFIAGVEVDDDHPVLGKGLEFASGASLGYGIDEGLSGLSKLKKIKK